MNAPPEPVSGRSIPRHRGPALHHQLRFFRTDLPDGRFRDGGLRAVCDAGDYDTTINGGYTAAHLAKLNRQHAGKP